MSYVKKEFKPEQRVRVKNTGSLDGRQGVVVGLGHSGGHMTDDYIVLFDLPFTTGFRALTITEVCLEPVL